jgi:hypothetical protein
MFPAFGFFEENIGLDGSSQASLAMAILPDGDPAMEPDFGILPSDLDDYLILPESASTTFSLPMGMVEGVRLDRTKVNYRRIQDWLQRCDEKHSGTCARPPRHRAVPISCIDCYLYTREIVPIGPGEEYLALS